MLQFADALFGLFSPEEREGQSLVEYALIIAFIAVVILVAAFFLHGEFSKKLTPIPTPTK